MIINFGKYKGKEINELPLNYLYWLKSPVVFDKSKKEKVYFKISKEIIEEANRIYDIKYREENYIRLRFVGAITSTITEYIIERLGDIYGITIHTSLDSAFLKLKEEYPEYTEQEILEGITSDYRDKDYYIKCNRKTPDPEDDRILIWEILPSGHKKVVWHFSGWHWDAEEFELEQGTLPGDNNSLYSIACIDI